MAVTPKTLYQGQPGATAAALYTSPGGRSATIHRAVVCNPTGGSVTLTLHAVPVSGTAGATNVVVNAKPIAAGATEILGELTGAVFETGQSLQGLAGSATSLTLTVWGSEIA